MSNKLTSVERKLIGSIAAHQSWANTSDRAARTAPARRALDARFLAEAGGNEERAEQLRKAHFQRLALKSAQSRRRAREATAAADAADAEMSDLSGDAA
ncbi:hypothetical protein [Allobranchiibius sp. GilTou73]|uniref:hypothetical protein n=1 Tax=Allobranchiibius sp. GilTou73 TaxID=2904523 RepID=UPI001F44CE60|nr:hypothetical protein [Allobranchiibius sp. GilTou73]UIJ34503.1 hypothetical protein LVQ62_15540 [Allobranchiibius sp. GilTou73]